MAKKKAAKTKGKKPQRRQASTKQAGKTARRSSGAARRTGETRGRSAGSKAKRKSPARKGAARKAPAREGAARKGPARKGPTRKSGATKTARSGRTTARKTRKSEDRGVNMRLAREMEPGNDMTQSASLPGEEGQADQQRDVDEGSGESQQA